METRDCGYLKQLLTFTNTRYLFFRVYAFLSNKHAVCSQLKDEIISQHGPFMSSPHGEELAELNSDFLLLQHRSQESADRLAYYMRSKVDKKKLKMLQPLLDGMLAAIREMRTGFVTKHVDGQQYGDIWEFETCLEHFDALTEIEFTQWQQLRSHEMVANHHIDSEQVVHQCIRLKRERDRLRANVVKAGAKWDKLGDFCTESLKQSCFSSEMDAKELEQHRSDLFTLVCNGEQGAVGFKEQCERLELYESMSCLLELKRLLQGLSELEILSDKDIERTLPEKMS